MVHTDLMVVMIFVCCAVVVVVVVVVVVGDAVFEQYWHKAWFFNSLFL